MPQSGFSLKAALDLISTVLMTVAAGVLLYNLSSSRSGELSQPLPAEPVPLDASTAIGNATAAVTVIVMSDFECPYCARFAHDSWPQIKSNWVDAGLVRFSFRHLPLRIHSRAARAAQAADCAAHQNAFWMMHDELFRTPGALAENDLLTYGERVVDDRGVFAHCMALPPSERIASDLAFAKSLGITATPTLVFGTAVSEGRVRLEKVIRGALTYDQFEQVTDKFFREKRIAKSHRGG